MWENVPVERTPESHVSGPTWESLVVVWSSLLLNCHVTVSPGATVTIAGEKALPGATWTV